MVTIVVGMWTSSEGRRILSASLCRRLHGREVSWARFGRYDCDVMVSRLERSLDEMMHGWGSNWSGGAKTREDAFAV